MSYPATLGCRAQHLPCIWCDHIGLQPMLVNQPVASIEMCRRTSRHSIVFQLWIKQIHFFQCSKKNFFFHITIGTVSARQICFFIQIIFATRVSFTIVAGAFCPMCVRLAMYANVNATNAFWCRQC